MLEKSQEVLAIASVPCQKWDKIYDLETALKEGTVFPELNRPFFKADKTGAALNNESGQKDALTKDCAQQEKESLMQQIYEVSFAVNDLTLYLDTHEDDNEALTCFQNYLKKRAELLQEFGQKFYPLTQACMAGCKVDAGIFCWIGGPVPWEGESL